MKGDDSVEARKEYAQEKSGENYEFDKSLEGMRLRQISFILISMVSSLENSRNNFVGESAIVRWAIVNVRNYMLGDEFTVISDCSGLKKLLIRGQCTPNVKNVVSQIVAVQMFNMETSRKDDVGLK